MALPLIGGIAGLLKLLGLIGAGVGAGKLGKAIKGQRDAVRGKGLDPKDPANRTPAGKFFLGEEGKFGTYDTLNPEQIAGISQILQSGLSQLGQFKPVDFGPIAKQSREQFNQQTIPSIAERFTSMGQGAQQSSAFPQILGAAGAGLDSSLAAQQSQFDLQQQDNQTRRMLGLLGLGMQPTFGSHFQQGQPGFLQQFLGPSIGAGLGLFGK